MYARRRNNTLKQSPTTVHRSLLPGQLQYPKIQCIPAALIIATGLTSKRITFGTATVNTGRCTSQAHKLINPQEISQRLWSNPAGAFTYRRITVLFWKPEGWEGHGLGLVAGVPPRGLSQCTVILFLDQLRDPRHATPSSGQRREALTTFRMAGARSPYISTETGRPQ
ncbi:hypothetical protein NDU88_010207 [Pleurodeles waltl]|uniref:Uncharacterized protein n=1 Tax=Pleurodeles waltl TaxID=8319 RepID=A0AAV7PX96_PLEWA|nr:hypothetical protein NDU88_010207 [Pleurodeles waltl]